MVVAFLRRSPDLPGLLSGTRASASAGMNRQDIRCTPLT